MSVLLLRSKVKADKAAEAEAGIKKMFAALEEARPQGVRYSSYRLPDGLSFVVLLDIDEGLENPLLAVPEFAEFQKTLATWLEAPAAVEQLTVAGEYRS